MGYTTSLSPCGTMASSVPCAAECMSEEALYEEAKQRYTFISRMPYTGNGTKVYDKWTGNQVHYLDQDSEQETCGFETWRALGGWNQVLLFRDWKEENIDSLGCCEETPTPCNSTGAIYPRHKKQKESAMNSTTQVRIDAIKVAPQMNFEAGKTDEATKRTYLGQRIAEISWKKRDDERKAYGLEDDEAPKTIKERKARIAAGKYVIEFNISEDEGEYDDECEYYGVARGTIVWRDPSVKKDKEGYEAAMKKLDDDQTKVRDIIAIFDAEKALEAVQEFETRTYH